MEEVVLVDEQDNAIGTSEKLAAHKQGKLHRAFSIFIFNTDGEMLLQQRAIDKYHSGGLWTNACCSHPRPNEVTLNAAKRRLSEELGMQTELSHLFSFLYKADFENGLIEHELDHVFVGIANEVPALNEQEAMAYKYINITDLLHDVQNQPNQYTFWFRKIVEEVIEKHKNSCG
ncbi:isopentenyl-diphosphate Delta-isomerase [Reichenbachiella carrageenanivorans]|uniref:Isopentenyl-diphosphate delta-isomerase n=1 Tax=Reichenbachiella carrageenanivorans TaxID=2979869 RepID=A0ABY6CWF4_9BACT|nr:isopentenyl-diphosphate Delta-isomerase [Reichenbachiella carrageenanivorans]UXX78246.1 isopentenyl-diphosphate Delta-isomerase [Reichenbachiella carrageenanivorans]